MILVDTAIWIDHLHRGEPRLVDLLGLDLAGCHPLVIEEVALGSIRQRDNVIGLLANLRQFPTAGHDEVMHLVERHRLWDRGLSSIDAHLMAAVLLAPGSRLWTRDKRLRSACSAARVAVFEEADHP